MVLRSFRFQIARSNHPFVFAQRGNIDKLSAADLLQVAASESKSDKLSNPVCLDQSDQSLAGSRETRVLCLLPWLLVLHRYIQQ